MEFILWYVIVYIIGYIIMMILCYKRNQITNDKNLKIELDEALIYSLTSWGGILIMILLSKDIFSKFKKTYNFFNVKFKN